MRALFVLAALMTLVSCVAPPVASNTCYADKTGAVVIYVADADGNAIYWPPGQAQKAVTVRPQDLIGLDEVRCPGSSQNAFDGYPGVPRD
jgi:hypothetical protein